MPQDPEKASLELEIKKLKRALEKQRVFIERTNASYEAKRQLSEIVLLERTRLERNMNLMLRHSTNMFLFFDVNGIVDFCADLFLDFKGLAGFGLIKGKGLREITQDFLPGDFIDKIENLLAAPLHQNAYSGEFKESTIEAKLQAYSQSEKEVRDYTAQAVLLINDRAEKDGLLIQLYDNTEYKQAQRAAEHANTAKSDFLATVSHEIRTPMNAIIGLTDMMLATELNVQQCEYLTKIQTSSVSMLGLINDILDFSKIEADKLEVINEYFKFGTMLKSLREMFEVMMHQKSLHFAIEFDAELPEVVWGDDRRIRQILTNILTNAYKYTASGSVRFAVRALGRDEILFEVTDTGIGIKEEDQSSLFREFEQLDVVRNKHITGTGLGLAITKRLVDLLRGRIEVHSVYGKGSTFSVTLPLKPGILADVPSSYDDTIPFITPAARILVVDDVEVNLDIAEFMLEPYGAQIVKAHDGLEAVQCVREQHFDLILMDQMMPAMDGIEATRIIRQLEGPAAKVPIVALTANAIQGMETTFKEAGFDAFVSKPINAGILAKTIHDLLPRELVVEAGFCSYRL